MTSNTFKLVNLKEENLKMAVKMVPGLIDEVIYASYSINIKNLVKLKLNQEYAFIRIYAENV